jgi:Raf kinase inhibitor-like YbhB/YbcL family protein
VRVTRLLVAMGALWLGVGCGADDRAMDPPSDSQTTTSGAAVSTSAGVEPAQEGFGLASAMFAQTGLIPDRYTCNGANVAPPLEWRDVPSGTVELAVVMRDLDAAGFIHWVVAGIDPSASGIVEGELPVAAVQAGNDLGSNGWTGPCPPSGTHRYEFRLYALTEPSEITGTMTGRDAATRIEGLPSAGEATLVGNVEAR